jgi:hypothetical protein
MKIRHGFVSNSSTTSFCIYGVCRDNDEELYKKFEVEDSWGLREVLEKKYPDIFTSGGPEGDCLYIGRELSSIKDNETGLEFKKSTAKMLSEIFGEEVSCRIMEEGWRDG